MVGREERGEWHLLLSNITVEDDASTWNVGDDIVIASTDFDFEQAERFKIVSVSGKDIAISGDLSKFVTKSWCDLYCTPNSQSLFLRKFSDYVHFGEVYEGLDMRAEVGMLTRNIKVQNILKV